MMVEAFHVSHTFGGFYERTRTILFSLIETQSACERRKRTRDNYIPRKRNVETIFVSVARPLSLLLPNKLRGLWVFHGVLCHGYNHTTISLTELMLDTSMQQR